ncbi:sensor histidine kinase [Rhizobacter sp. LjRoot28]|uniref:sensor histidine kinase n=1 Tax=Rhizobacter sp. LjRoot28 TaxID=3342309 RepID=UPI003ED0DEB9
MNGAAPRSAARERPGAAPRWRSLRVRLLAATLVALLVALVLAGLLLASLFRDHVMRQFEDGLVAQLDQVTARLEFDTTGQPRIDPASLSDPRWSRPYSGLYWQVDDLRAEAPRRAVLRSRSLWDTELAAPADQVPDGAVHVHTVPGPGGTHLLLAERTVRPRDPPAPTLRLLVAADLAGTEAAVDRFNGVLAWSLAVLLLLLCVAALAQVAVGLAPLRALQRALSDVQAGREPRLAGHFPAEVRPLTDDFNQVLDRNAELVARARTQAGNLAHAIKTPLAAMAQGAAAARKDSGAAAELPDLVMEQVALARRHVDWQLARVRAAAAQGGPSQRVPVAPLVAGLLRVLDKVHADRALNLAAHPIDPALSFSGDGQALQEMLGNLLDNACKWARHEVRIAVHARTGTAGPGDAEAKTGAPLLEVHVDDDGPGIAPERRELVMQRGTRLDETVPGSGLGLAIVRELAELQGGAVALGTSPLGGLRVSLTLPRAD